MWRTAPHRTNALIPKAWVGAGKVGSRYEVGRQGGIPISWLLLLLLLLRLLLEQVRSLSRSRSEVQVVAYAYFLCTSSRHDGECGVGIVIVHPVCAYVCVVSSDGGGCVCVRGGDRAAWLGSARLGSAQLVGRWPWALLSDESNYRRFSNLF
jgi:hypothetical protein